MLKPIVGVKFENDQGRFEGKTYTYYCDIKVAYGDIVVAPTVRGESIAQITEVDIPAHMVDPRIRELLKTITQKAEETQK